MRQRGFTLIELLVVLAIVALLLTLALPRYMGSAEIAKERVLVENLRVTRDAIDKHFADRGRYPESLDALVERRYLRELPFDPLRDSRTAWNVVPPPSGRDGGVYDLHSSAPGATRDGRAYSEL
ncbi:type II secretion system protein [Niveibacterium sp.]|uniref:type II secretion system protein n=1 Tax=Niveibacterium sp. TaxID=2017444 RepID=UPI0035B09FEF